MSYDLIIFDIDGTLVKDFDSVDPLPGRVEFFSQPRLSQIAFATNQGGVGLRYWMQQGGWGEPEKYPTEAQARQRLEFIKASLGIFPETYVCFCFQAKNGNWGPTPYDATSSKGVDAAPPPEWRPENRKPAPGMLIQAMEAAGVAPSATLMVGDRDEDEAAARAAGCAFEWAEVFFGPESATLEGGDAGE